MAADWCLNTPPEQAHLIDTRIANSHTALLLCALHCAAANPTCISRSIYDPDIGAAAGYAHEVNGVWSVVAGPGSGGGVGCGTVPDSVLSQFAGSPVSS